MAVSLTWCYFACILCYAKEPGTEGFREVHGHKCWMHLWKPPQVFLGQVPPWLHFHTVPLYWAAVFFEHSLTGSKATCSELREGRALLLCGLWEELWLTQPAWMLNCCATERILICSNRMGVRQAASPASANHRSPPEINAIMPILIDS